MGKDDRDWLPERDRPRLDRVARAGRSPPALAAIEAAAEPLGIPIVDRDTGRVLSVLAGGRRRIVEVGTAYGYSTLWLALGQPRRRDDRDDRPGPRADRPRPRLVARGRASPTSGSRSSTAPALDAFAAAEPALAGPFDLAFIDALKPEYAAYLEALVRGSRPARSSSPTTSCGAGARRARGRLAAGRREHRRRCARSTRASSPTRGSPRRSCRSATACSSPRGAADGSGR